MDILRRGGQSPSTSDEGPSPDELKGWTVRFSPAGGQGGWASVKDWELLEQPPTKTEFEINTGELDPGTYRLFWIEQDTERIQMPPDELSWKKTVEGEVDEEPDPELVADRAAKKALAEIQREQAGSAMEGTVMDLAETPEDLLKLMSMFNEDWLREQGNHAVARAWGLAGENELGFEDYKENPIGAFFFDSYKEPQQLRELGQSLGAGGSAFFDGLLAGYDDPEAILQDEIEQAGDEVEAAADSEQYVPKGNSGPKTLDDLGVDRPAPSDVARALDDTKGRDEAGEDGQHGDEPDVGGPGPSGDGDAEEPATADAGGPDNEEEVEADEAPLVDADPDLTDEDIAAAMEEL